MPAQQQRSGSSGGRRGRQLLFGGHVTGPVALRPSGILPAVAESLQHSQGIGFEAEYRMTPAEHHNTLRAGLPDGRVLGQLAASGGEGQPENRPKVGGGP